MSEEDRPLVIDTGSGQMKVGQAGDDLPCSIFPNIIGRPKYEKVMETGGKQYYIGDEAQKKRGVLTLQYPVNKGIISSWDDMTKIWDHTFKNVLRVDPKGKKVMQTEPPNNPRSNRHKMTEIMFETFEVDKFFVQIQAVLSLQAAGKTTGCVLDSGDGVSHTVPIYEGYTMSPCINRANIAGRTVTTYLQKLLSSRNENQYIDFTKSNEFEIVRQIKENKCYIALDYEAEKKKFADNPELGCDIKLPDGSSIHVDTELFEACEVFFDSAKGQSVTNEEYKSLQDLLHQSIYKSDVDIRLELLNNIVLSGGSTCFTNYKERLESELAKKLPSEVKVRVISPDNKEKLQSVWIGGSVLAGLTTFESQWITKQEYDERGPVIVDQKCV